MKGCEIELSIRLVLDLVKVNSCLTCGTFHLHSAGLKVFKSPSECSRRRSRIKRQFRTKSAKWWRFISENGKSQFNYNIPWIQSFSFLPLQPLLSTSQIESWQPQHSSRTEDEMNIFRWTPFFMGMETNRTRNQVQIQILEAGTLERLREIRFLLEFNQSEPRSSSYLIPHSTFTQVNPPHPGD